MSYELAESSIESGAPFFLYEFSTPSTTYRFTSLSITHTVNSFSWVPVEIKHGDVKQTHEISKNTLKITMSLGNGITDLYIGWSPDHTVSVTMYRGHVGQSDTLLYWKGRISGVSLAEKTMSFSCDSVFTTLSRYGLRARYTKACRHALYNRGCSVDKDVHKVESYIGITTKLSVKCPNSEVDNHFIGGIIEFEDGSTRFVSGQHTDTMQLNIPSKYMHDIAQSVGYGLSYGEVYGAKPVTLYPGCDRTLATCVDKFNNGLNNGGFKWMPETNPMNGTSIV